MELKELIYLTKHKAETSEFNKGYYVDVLEQLERLEQIKQVWNSEEWCQGIPCNADGLKSLFNYNLDLFNKNLTLDKRVLDLEKENQELKFLLECKSKGNEIIIKQMDLFMKQRDKTIEENEQLKQKVKTYEDLLHTIEEEVLGE